MDQSPLIGIHGTQALGFPQALDLLGRQNGDVHHFVLQVAPEVTAVHLEYLPRSVPRGHPSQDNLESADCLSPSLEKEIPIGTVQINLDPFRVLDDPKFKFEGGGREELAQERSDRT